LLFSGALTQCDDVVFSSLPAAWLFASRLHDPSLELPALSLAATNSAFRLADQKYAHINYSLSYLLILHKRLQTQCPFLALVEDVPSNHNEKTKEQTQ
jgi:hypothetical protein